MTTQSDREKAEAAALKSPYCNNINGPTYTQACDAYRDGYLAGSQSKDREWQAKVQGLVDAFSATMILLNDAMIWNRPGNRKKFSDQMDRNRQALTQFASGQPAKGVMVPIEMAEEMMSVIGRAKILTENSVVKRKAQEQLEFLEQSIKGIGKDL